MGTPGLSLLCLACVWNVDSMGRGGGLGGLGGGMGEAVGLACFLPCVWWRPSLTHPPLSLPRTTSYPTMPPATTFFFSCLWQLCGHVAGSELLSSTYHETDRTFSLAPLPTPLWNHC